MGDPERAKSLRVLALKWANSITLTYAFFEQQGDGSPHPWRGRAEEREVVRRAFKTWKNVGIGLRFREVDDPQAALIRIGFGAGEGSWSYIGTACLDPSIPSTARTMNFGWSLLGKSGFDTALHEIGHALGMPHEHQNPRAGIEWDQAKVLEYFSGPPNKWDPPTIIDNILRKLPEDEVEGGPWDRDSVMHYPFAAGLIRKPVECQGGIRPAGGLSPQDKAWVREFYPSHIQSFLKLALGKAQEFIDKSGAQSNFVFVPSETRPYFLTAVGDADKRITVVEDLEGGDETLLKSDDDSGHDRDASLQVELIRGRRYKIIVNTNFSRETGAARLHIE